MHKVKAPRGLNSSQRRVLGAGSAGTFGEVVFPLMRAAKRQGAIAETLNDSFIEALVEVYLRNG
jgi:hypothetical protein